MDKNVDEKWKDFVENEKSEDKNSASGDRAVDVTFNAFISSLAIEGLIFLGEVANPATKKKETNLTQARYMIDTLSIIKDKTRGNLSADEANNLDNILYELRSNFITKNK